MGSKLKHEIYAILDESDHHNKVSRGFNIFLIILICLNVIAVCLETVESLSLKYHSLFYYFEVFSVTVFSIEYILRVWTITVNNKYKDPISGRIKFIFTFSALIDIVAILPFYLPMVIPVDLRILRILRLIRLIRIFKMSRYLHATQLIGRVIKAKKEELSISFFLVIFLMIVVSAIMFYVEHEAQPDKFSSIPATMWWSVSALTSVGYGDMLPVTVLGKTLASVISLLGIGLVALPAGIMASGFSEEMRKTHPEHKNVCPHCGQEI